MRRMTFELGVYSFGNVQRRPDGGLDSAASAIRNVLEAIQLAEQVGLDFFGVGEHHTLAMPISSPASVVNAAAAVTRRIGLGSTVTVLSTDDPIRVYQQHATAAAISGGRVDITVGRGSSTDSFPLFGYHLADYDELYAAKLDLLLQVNETERVTWSGPYRDISLQDALVVPRAERKLKIWLGTGGNPQSTIRAGMLGIPVAYGILAGTTPHWRQLADLYYQAAGQAGHPPQALDISVATHGFIARDGRQAKEAFYRSESSVMGRASLHGDPKPDPAFFDQRYFAGGMVFAGDPSEIADRLIDFQQVLGHSRHILQMDLGHMPHQDVLRSIELLGAEVLPRVRSALG
jgi:alkanesulfonate monooxygenase SsuD/methylene tetrahydromethanopterin reductase-like flavin-dependent oxidoreductase (luciferase family)